MGFINQLITGGPHIAGIIFLIFQGLYYLIILIGGVEYVYVSIQLGIS